MGDHDLDSIIINLKACLVSVKGGIPLNQLENDYFKLNSEQIQFKSLGFSSLEALLLSSGKFIIQNHDGNKIVQALPTNKTQHLTDLIKKQKSKPPKKVLVPPKKVSFAGTKVVSQKLITSSYNRPNIYSRQGSNNSNSNTDYNKPDSLIRNLNQINMPKSNSRIISECKNCSLCEKIIDIHKHNDIKQLLSNVEQWDTQVITQFRQINRYYCFPCDFKSVIFIDWICHIMSVSHMKICHKIEDLYSHICWNTGCKILLYGPKESIIIHKNMHLQDNNILGISIFMAKVMKRFINKLVQPLYFCSHCKKSSVNPIHVDYDKTCKPGLKCPIHYYCKFCKVIFVTSPEMLDYHSLSVEHMFLKCLDKLCTKTKIDTLEDNLLPVIQGNIKMDLNNDNIARKENVDESFSSLVSLQIMNTEFFENGVINDIHDNIAYGQYVTKRLNNIENVTVQDYIKLEIDNLFYKTFKSNVKF